ncbi:hypothetical protein ACQEVB_05520 [Pseudonocardia sp. CA-107938]|uniref:hypothetical protein n=1 Tax=Pseudonocardia sp. CA-107938 TaxID=3240021 RepID=UPI003D8FF9F8
MDGDGSAARSTGLTPGELAAAAVPGAARVVGVSADAVVSVDATEHARRIAAGLGPVLDVSVLQALMHLPLHAEVSTEDLGEVNLRLLGKAPTGCVDWLDGGSRVRRRYTPAAAVSLVVVRGATWRPALRRAATFEPFAARTVLLTRPPRRVTDIAWEADVDGTGLWIVCPGRDHCGEIDEAVTPAPYVSRYLKPAKWQFAEHAYAAWLAQTTQTAAPTETVPRGRPVGQGVSARP